MRAWGAFAASAALHALALLAIGVLEFGTPDHAPAPLRVRVLAPGSGPPPLGAHDFGLAPPRGTSPTSTPEGAPEHRPNTNPWTPRPMVAPEPEDREGPSSPESPDPALGGQGPARGALPGLGAAPEPDRPAQLVAEVRPPYPREARTRGWEGAVVLEVGVGGDGRVSGVVVRASSGRGLLDRAAIEAVWGASFLPALRAGVPEPTTVVVTIRFQLQ